jgi:hypothetical protein
MEKKDVKMVLVSGASKALEMQRKNPKMSEGEIIQHILKNANEILAHIK